MLGIPFLFIGIEVFLFLGEGEIVVSVLGKCYFLDERLPPVSLGTLISHVLYFTAYITDGFS